MPNLADVSKESLSFNSTCNADDNAGYTYELSSVAEDGTSKRVICDKGLRSCILDKLNAARSYAAAITACFTLPKEGKLCSIRGDVSNVWTSPLGKLGVSDNRKFIYKAFPRLTEYFSARPTKSRAELTC